MAAKVRIAMCCPLRITSSTWSISTAGKSAHSVLSSYDKRCYFNVRSKADMSRLNLPHGDDN